MTPSEQQRFDLLYQQHLTNLTLQGKRPATIDAYSRLCAGSQPILIVALTTHHTRIKSLLRSTHCIPLLEHSETRSQRCTSHVLNKQWLWLNIVKPPQSKSLPDISRPPKSLRLLTTLNSYAIRSFSSRCTAPDCAWEKAYHCRWVILTLRACKCMFVMLKAVKIDLSHCLSVP